VVDDVAVSAGAACKILVRECRVGDDIGAIPGGKRDRFREVVLGSYIAAGVDIGAAFAARRYDRAAGIFDVTEKEGDVGAAKCSDYAFPMLEQPTKMVPGPM
jgi:hypothetical protein